MKQQSKRRGIRGLVSYFAIILGICAGLLSDFIFRAVFDLHGVVVRIVSLTVMVAASILTALIGKNAIDRLEAKERGSSAKSVSDDLH